MKKFKGISPKRFYWEQDGGDRIKACSSDYRLIATLAQSLVADAPTFRSVADSFDGTRKAIAFGTFKYRSPGANGMRIDDAEMPHIIPRATSLLDAVKRRYDGPQGDVVIALTPEAVMAAKVGRRWSTEILRLR